MPGGRPTDYSEEIVKKTQEYIDSCEDTTELVGTNIYTKVNLPSIEGLACYIKVSRPTIYLWKQEHKEFSYILEDLLAKQARVLLSNGLSGRYNSTISKLILTKHGYTDKQEVEHSGKMEIKKISVDIIGDSESKGG
jgi:hypothetical protein